MAMLINDNDTLKKYVPNTLKAVGETLIRWLRIRTKVENVKLFVEP